MTKPGLSYDNFRYFYVILHSDVTALTQLITLFERYEGMLSCSPVRINFLAVCEDKQRAREYELAGQRIIGGTRGDGGDHPLVVGYSIDYRYY